MEEWLRYKFTSTGDGMSIRIREAKIDPDISEQEYGDYIEEKLNSIETREDLAEYLYDLSEGYQAGFMEERSVVDYVDGAAAFTKALHGYCKNFNLECPEQPDWRWVGEIFTAAFEHS